MSHYPDGVTDAMIHRHFGDSRCVRECIDCDGTGVRDGAPCTDCGGTGEREFDPSDLDPSQEANP